MHVALLGDSIFDNATYVPGEQAVVEQLQSVLPKGSTATLIAVDGSVTAEVLVQLKQVPPEASHLVVSSGGNDALHASVLLEEPQRVIGLLADAQNEFRKIYRKLVQGLKMTTKPILVCTIYDSVPHLGKEKKTALSIFNDVIVSEASRAGISVIDLRSLCNDESDYSELSPIEPSTTGGMKIAKRIAWVVQKFDFKFQRTILF